MDINFQFAQSLLILVDRRNSVYQSTLFSSSSLLFFQYSLRLTSHPYQPHIYPIIPLSYLPTPLTFYSPTHHGSEIYRAHQSKAHRLCLELACRFLLFARTPSTSGFQRGAPEEEHSSKLGRCDYSCNLYTNHPSHQQGQEGKTCTCLPIPSMRKGQHNHLHLSNIKLTPLQVFTRAEHRRRHELNHNPEASYRCATEGCNKAFHRADLLVRHMERQ